MDKNKIKKEKKEEQIEIPKEDNNFALSEKENLPYISYIEKTIKGDGNCFFCCISYYYKNNENYHLEFRNLFYEWMVEHKVIFKDFILDDQDSDRELTTEERVNILSKKIEAIKEPSICQVI